MSDCPPGSYVPPSQVVGSRILADGAWYTEGLVYRRPSGAGCSPAIAPTHLLRLRPLETGQTTFDW
ncbi:MAG TPA: hypothetical protein EYP04_11515 [Anaerolineae bacterium]|nr:hypothetical protein [Anaerolineae bacterium]